jgi:hypothetical protein
MLAEIQHRLRRSILVALDGDLDRIVKGGEISPERRIGIHRNHLQISLAQALATSFPATRAVVGTDFFEQTARAFALAHPPAGPCLFEYGADLPDYLDGLPALRELPYLGDLARFEWLLNAVHHAPDHGVLDAARLAAVPPAAVANLRFLPVPSARLFESAFPILQIWRLAKGHAAEGVSLDEGGVRLLIQRRGDIALWRALPAAEYGFLGALFAGGTLGDAASPDLDLAAALARCLGDGVFLDLLSGDTLS